MSQFTTEEERIQGVYTQRTQEGLGKLYSWQNENTHLSHYRQNTVFIWLLKQLGISDLEKKEFLDIGCGRGDWLQLLLGWGASPSRLHGIDLMEDRIAEAKYRAPHFDLRVATGWGIPFTDSSIDIVSANTVFSSILNPEARKALALEMIRVVKSDGCIAIYDFFVSHPGNPNTIGIRKKEIFRLFQGMKVTINTLTLAPPIARRTIKLSPLMTHALEIIFPFFRSHALYMIIPKKNT